MVVIPLGAGLGAYVGSFAGTMAKVRAGRYDAASVEHPVEPRGGRMIAVNVDRPDTEKQGDRDPQAPRRARRAPRRRPSGRTAPGATSTRAPRSPRPSAIRSALRPPSHGLKSRHHLGLGLQPVLVLQAGHEAALLGAVVRGLGNQSPVPRPRWALRCSPHRQQPRPERPSALALAPRLRAVSSPVWSVAWASLSLFRWKPRLDDASCARLALSRG